MQVENHKEEVPFAYYEGLFKKIDPREVAGRLSHVSWDGSAFSVTLLGTTYVITWPNYSISSRVTIPSGLGNERVDEHQARSVCGDPPLPVQTFLLRYLMESKDVAWNGTWKTFREMPWGEMYIKPYTGRVLTRAAFTFGTRVAAFKAACEKMGATELPHGDAGYQFDFIGGYSIQILVWEGDDEFPPNAQVIYSDNFAEGFAAEDRVVAGDILISMIKTKM